MYGYLVWFLGALSAQRANQLWRRAHNNILNYVWVEHTIWVERNLVKIENYLYISYYMYSRFVTFAYLMSLKTKSFLILFNIQ